MRCIGATVLLVGFAGCAQDAPDVTTSPAALALGGVTPSATSVDEGQLVSWSGPYTTDGAEGPPLRIAWDFDGDGTDDHVACGSGSGVSCLQGCSFELFETGGIIVTSNSVMWILVTDLDGVGNDDLVLTDFAQGPGQYQTFTALANGHRTYAPAQLTATDAGRWAAGDLDDDNDIDLVGTINGIAGVRILRGAGNGTFASEAIISGRTADVPPLLVDVDEDLDLDIVVSSRFDMFVDVYRNNGNGSFGAVQALPVPVPPRKTSAADLDGDTHVDLIAVGYATGPGTIAVLHGNGDGTFDPAVTVATTISATSVGAGDLDADDDVDVLVTGAQGSAVFWNNGTGGLTTSTPVVLTAPGRVIDFNNDGRDDIVSPAEVLINGGGGTFVTNPTGVQVSGVNARHSFDVEDLDGDQRLDLIVALESDGGDLVRAKFQRAATWQCSISATATYRDSKGTGSGPTATYVPRLTVEASGGQVATATWNVTVADVAPTLTDVAAASLVEEGDSVSVAATWHDPGARDVINVLYDWGDGASNAVDYDNPSPGDDVTTAALHRYADAGSYVVAVTATDDEGRSSLTRTVAITVADHMPAIQAVTTNAPVEVGSAATIWIVVDDADADSLVYDVDWNGDGDFDDAEDTSGGGSNMASFARPTAGTVTVHVRARDDEGNQATGEVTVTWEEREGSGSGGCRTAGDAGLALVLAAIAGLFFRAPRARRTRRWRSPIRSRSPSRARSRRRSRRRLR